MGKQLHPINSSPSNAQNFYLLKIHLNFFEIRFKSNFQISKLNLIFQISGSGSSRQIKFWAYFKNWGHTNLGLMFRELRAWEAPWNYMTTTEFLIAFLVAFFHLLMSCNDVYRLFFVRWTQPWIKPKNNKCCYKCLPDLLD